jgi:hypothetical protein
VFLLTSCLTYYQKSGDFQSKFEAGQLQDAQAILNKINIKNLHKTLILYKLNQGVIHAMLGDYTTSNTYFEDAYLMGEDHQRNYANEAASFLFNPNITVYQPEMHEMLLVQYYKAINYLKLGLPEEALVECKRINIELAQYNQLYTSDKKLKDDAFAHTLMGIIYQANDDYNNAFIAYRNAYTIYKNEYTTFFGVSAPKQLIKDMLYVAYKTGFQDEVEFYEKETGVHLEIPDSKNDADVVFFWNDGLGPVKDQFVIDFVLIRGQNGVVIFENRELGLSFPFYMSDNDYKNSGLAALQIYRVAFPKYRERPLVFTHGSLSVNNTSVPLELAMDINKVSFKSLQDRMLTEMAKSLLRFAMKKALEFQIRKENQTVGALVGVFDALTENADTRNWQTLPHSVFYSRVALPAGTYKASLDVSGGQSASQSIPLAFELKSGNTSFYNYYSLEYQHY